MGVLYSNARMRPEDWNFEWPRTNMPEEVFLWCFCVGRQVEIWFSAIDNCFYAKNENVFYEFDRRAISSFLSQKEIDVNSVNGYSRIGSAEIRYMFKSSIRPDELVKEFIEKYCNNIKPIK